MSDETPFLDYEENYHSNEKQQSRKDRKVLQRKDRSKFKKTDQDKVKVRSDELQEGENLGRIIQVLPEHMAIVEHDAQQFTCSYKGSFRYEKNQQRNILVVGDLVHYIENERQERLITHIRERYSTLSRVESKQTRRMQILAANVDQVLITISILEPRLKPHLIDRYVIAAMRGNMLPVLILTKADLLDLADDGYRLLIHDVVELYEGLGIPVIMTSTESEAGLESLKKILHNRVSVFSGQSGVGKTSLINAITGREYKTQNVMQHNRKGMHTTTSSILLHLDEDSYCVDTPGIKSFGMEEIDAHTLQDYFEEITQFGRECRFSTCTHVHEPDCNVKKAVEEDKISPLRYLSYCNLLSDETP